MLLSCPNSKHHPAKWYVIPSSHQFRFLIEVASQRPIEIYREKTQVTDAVSSYDYCYNIDARNWSDSFQVAPFEDSEDSMSREQEKQHSFNPV